MRSHRRLSRTTGSARVTVMLVALFAGLIAWTAPAMAAAVALPDMKILVPTNLISISVDPATGHRMLRYTHITEDAGTGPFEIDPAYNPATGIASFVQSIYNSPSPGVWNLDHTVPVAVNGTFVNGSDYRFPLTAFTLQPVNADGTLGSVVATSPKTDYCITGDNRVGDVPNTPSGTTPPASNCSDPTKALGWSVGWGDQYDQTDSGQPIDINSLPDGSYVLRAIVDPQHVLTESSVTNNVTDTRLTIRGTTVTVGAQTQPTVTPPSVTITNPAPGASVTGTVTLSVAASAAAPATVSSVQYLLDGNPLGGPQTAPFSYPWTVGSTPTGSHRLSAQATDSTGSIATAPVVQVNVPSSGGTTGFAVDRTLTQNGHGTTTTSAFSTSSAGETLVAFVGADGPASSGSQSVSVSGAGLSWRRVVQANAQYGDAEVWTATASLVLSGVTVTSTPTASNFDQQLSVLAFTGSNGVGASASASAATGAPSARLTSTAAGSLSYAAGADWDNATARTVGTGQVMLSQRLDTTTGDTFWVQGTATAVSASGQAVTLNDTAPTTDRWNLAAVEVIPNGTPPPPPPPDTTPPTASIVSPAAGQTVSGTTSVVATASDNVAVASVQLLLDGQALGAPVVAAPYAVQWDTTKASSGSHTLSARALDTAGNTGTSSPITVTVQNPVPPMTCFVLQTQKSVHGSGTVTTPALTTAMAGEVLVAFVASDGPAASNAQSVTVSGAGLTWTLVTRANGEFGDSEIWTATAATVLTNATVVATPARSGFDQDLTVIAMEGVLGVGASASRSAASGAATLNLTTTAATSLVFAVGNDWDRATARTLPTGLVALDQWVDTRTGDTYWSEYTNQPTGTAGTSVTIGTTAPTGDQWNLAAVELKNSGG